MSVCKLCKKYDAVFIRPYSKERLCRKCFCKSTENRVRFTISKYKMLEPNDKVMVAVSGGKDSVALLHMLKKIERPFINAVLYAVTVNEGISGYRDEALKVAKNYCRILGVEHVVTSFKKFYGYDLDEIVNKARRRGKGGLMPCSYCGVLRRKVLNIAAREAGMCKLATGHTLDDETQTMFLNIIRGDAKRITRVRPKSKGIHPKLVQRIKPLCVVPEKEVVLYAYLQNIEFQSIPCPYAKTALRNDVRNMLNRMEEKHAGIKFSIFKSLENIKPALETIAEKVEFQLCKICGEPTTGKTCRSCQMLQEISIL